jgi:ATP-dependent DNA helicase RecG
VKFIGTEPRGEGGLPGYGRREEIGGPLARVIENAWEVVWEEMHVGAVSGSSARRNGIPPVCRALVNAVCHRDIAWGRWIEIRMFADRLEVIGPGGLPGSLPSTISSRSTSRNPRMVRPLSVGVH